MAEKHKSKYKKPENTKPKYRKDIKDYTYEDKDGKLNPYTTGEKQKNVLRKTDKEFVDTGDLYVKYNADDRLYKDVEEGEYDPKHAAKVLKKRQDADEKLSKDQIKDKIENLTREGKERLVREYISKKIKRKLHEQPTPAETPKEEAPVIDEPATDPMATDPMATDSTAAPAPDPTAAAPAPDPMAATPAAPAPDPTAAAPAAPAPEPEKTPEQALGTALQEKNVFDKVGSVLDVIKISLDNSKDEPKSISEFYKFLIMDLVKQRNEFLNTKRSK